jgi:hypothetical protein
MGEARQRTGNPEAPGYSVRRRFGRRGRAPGWAAVWQGYGGDVGALSAVPVVLVLAAGQLSVCAGAYGWRLLSLVSVVSAAPGVTVVNTV